MSRTFPTGPAALLASLALALTACGQSGGGVPQAPGPAPSGGPPSVSPSPAVPSPPLPLAPVEADLTVVRYSTDHNERTTWTLTCTESGATAGSTVPDPEAACDALARHGRDVFFTEPDPDQVCTMIYGGPQRAHVTGMLNGQAVDEEFSLLNGCRIATWQTMSALLGSIDGGLEEQP